MCLCLYGFHSYVLYMTEIIPQELISERKKKRKVILLFILGRYYIKWTYIPTCRSVAKDEERLWFKTFRRRKSAKFFH